jgi:hypothetical protein
MGHYPSSVKELIMAQAEERKENDLSFAVLCASAVKFATNRKLISQVVVNKTSDRL